MERRDAVKALAALPFVTHVFKPGIGKVEAAELKSGSYVVFADPQCFDFDSLYNLEPGMYPPELEQAVFIPIQPRPGQTIHDAIAIYKLDGIA